MSLYKTYFVAC